MYRGYFNTREGKELVAIKTCKRMFIHVYTRVKQNNVEGHRDDVPKIREQDRSKRYTHLMRGCSHGKGNMLQLSLVLRLTHCMHIRTIAPEFQGDRILLQYVRILMMSR